MLILTHHNRLGALASLILTSESHGRRILSRVAPPLKSRAMSRVSKPLLLVSWILLVCTVPLLRAETCWTSADMDPAAKSSIDAAARQDFNYAAQGDVFDLRQSATPDLAANFGGIEGLVIDQKAAYAGAQANIRDEYLLEASGNAPVARAEFLCGIYNSPQRSAFVINNLPPGRYAIVIQDVTTSKGPYLLTLILKQQNGAWKLAGYYSKPAQIGGHDGDWYLSKAREFKTKSETRDAWFYYMTAWDLLAPVDFISTPKLDKIADEMQSVRPADLPAGNPVDLVTGNKTYKLTRIFPDRSEQGLVLVVKYQSPDISNTQQTFEDTMAVIKALVKKYPEYRDAFTGVVARAVSPSGGEYASLLAMKDVK